MPLIPPPEFTANEQAPHLSALYVYIIAHEDGTRAYYSGFDRAVTLFNIPAAICPEEEATFLPSNIKHEAITVSDKFQERSCVLRLDTSDTMLRRYFLTAAAVKLRCWIVRVGQSLITDTIDWTTSAFIAEVGILSKFSFSGLTIAAEVVPEPFQVNFSIPRYWFQKLCNHVLYGVGCGLDKEPFSWTTTILSVNVQEKELVLAGRLALAAADHFELGMFYHAASQLNFSIAWSAFEGASDTIIKLGYWNPELEVGQTVKLYPGCRHTPHDCQTKFANQANYGGFAYVPPRNPATQGVN